MARILWIPGISGDLEPIISFFRQSPYEYEIPALTNGPPELWSLQQLFASPEWDLIFCPFRRGEVLLADLLAESPGKAPVVVVGESRDAGELAAALAGGAADYLLVDPEQHYLALLPFTISRLLSACRNRKPQLSPSEQEYEAIIQNLPDIIYKIDPQGYFSFVNQAVRALGYEPEDLIGHHFREILHPEDYSKVSWQEIDSPTAAPVKLFNERRQDPRQTNSLEIRLVPKAWRRNTGAVVIGSMTIIGEINARGHYREKDGEADFLGTVGIIFNVTRYKESQILIRKLYQVTDQSPISILITDTAGKIEYVNPRFLQLHGYAQEEVLDCDISLLKTKRIFPGHYPGFREILQAGRAWQGEVVSLRKNGSEFWESVSVKPLLDAAGTVINYVICKVDIDELKATQEVLKTINNELDKRVTQRTRELQRTNRELQQEIEERKTAQEEQKKLEAQLLQSQKMETIGTLAGGIAHDFNNILTPIIGFTNIALLEIGEGNPGFPEVLQIQTAADRARDLVQQILSFASVVDPKRIPVEINSILEEAINLLRASLPATIEIRKDIELDYGLILANPSQIHQVIINLCTNAAHAMHGSYGVLGFRIRRLIVASSRVIEEEEGVPLLPAGKYIRLDVCDTGKGIRPEILSRIFDPFFTTKSKKQGTGLGLSVALGIITNHDGKITVSSIPGQGTTFSLFLPLYEGEAANPLQDHVELKGGDEHILYIDDEPQVALTVTRMLSILGYQVTKHTDSVRALEEYKLNPRSFDLVITDYTMPILTGLELIRQIRDFGYETPLILITGYGDGILMKESENEEIDAILMKPLSLDELGTAVRRVLDQARRKG